MIMREASTPRPAPLHTKHERYIANAVLPALRRNPTRVTQGTNPPWTIHGANSVPNGPGPLEHARWYLGHVNAHPGLDIPRTGLLISETTLHDAPYEVTPDDWADLMHVTLRTSIGTLYDVIDTPHGWQIQRNQYARNAPVAAVAIVRLAHLAGHVRPVREVAQWKS